MGEQQGDQSLTLTLNPGPNPYPNPNTVMLPIYTQLNSTGIYGCRCKTPLSPHFTTGLIHILPVQPGHVTNDHSAIINQINE